MKYGEIGALTYLVLFSFSALGADSKSIQIQVTKKKQTHDVVSRRGTPVQLSVLEERARLKKQADEKALAKKNAFEKKKISERKIAVERAQKLKKVQTALASTNLASTNELPVKNRRLKEADLARVITPKSLREELASTQKIMGSSCENEAVATRNENVLKLIYMKTSKRAQELRDIEARTKIALIEPAGVMKFNVVSSTSGVAENKVKQLESQRAKIQDTWIDAKRFATDEKRELLLDKKTAKRSLASANRIKREKNDAKRAVIRVANLEKQLKKFDLEISKWKSKVASLGQMQPKEPSKKAVKATVAEKSKDLLALSPQIGRAHV